jgi:hypothetical protein
MKDNLIHPEDSGNILYWTKKWGVSIQQLRDAILYTGSLNSENVKAHLKKDIWYYSPVIGLVKLFKTTFNFIH